MIRQLFVILFVVGLGWLLRRIFGAAAMRSGSPTGPYRGPHPGSGVPDESGGEMVRDRICNTFLPRASALSKDVAGEQHFFCSERCRQTFLERL